MKLILLPVLQTIAEHQGIYKLFLQIFPGSETKKASLWESIKMMPMPLALGRSLQPLPTSSWATTGEGSELTVTWPLPFGFLSWGWDAAPWVSFSHFLIFLSLIPSSGASPLSREGPLPEHTSDKCHCSHWWQSGAHPAACSLPGSCTHSSSEKQHHVWQVQGSEMPWPSAGCTPSLAGWAGQPSAPFLYIQHPSLQIAVPCPDMSQMMSHVLCSVHSNQVAMPLRAPYNSVGVTAVALEMPTPHQHGVWKLLSPGGCLCFPGASLSRKTVGILSLHWWSGQFQSSCSGPPAASSGYRALKPPAAALRVPGQPVLQELLQRSAHFYRCLEELQELCFVCANFSPGTQPRWR